MKSVLISIQPKWCELIASGKKTVEVRKTKPKLETPFKCYIYCTKAKEHFSIGGGVYATSDTLYRLPTGEIKFGDGFELMGDWSGQYDESNFLNGKVIGEFVCDAIFPVSCYYSDVNARGIHREQPYTCLTDKEMIDYLGNGVEGYGWHISDLVIYDKPKALSEFYQNGKNGDTFYYDYCAGCPHHETPISEYPCNECDGNRNYLYRPPQSWCYVEEVDDDRT